MKGKLGIQPKYIKMILYVVGALILVLVLAYVKPSLDATNEELTTANEQLTQQKAELDKLAMNMSTYEEQSKEFEEENLAIIAQFPIEVRTEDTIMYAKHIQDDWDMEVHTIAATPGNLVYAMNVGGLSLSYDSETGKIVGNLNVNRYYLTGTEDVYESPDTGVIQKGSDNIFGTIENPDR